MSILKNIVLFIILLSIIVSIHEFGHLLAAKFFGVYCKEYSIGMGPKLFSKKGKETEYCIRAFPVGGFVAMAGDTDNSLETKIDVTDLPPERTLLGIAKWKKIIIMLAGIFMNMILAIVIYSLLILANGSYVTSSKPQISSIREGSPAYYSELKEGDIVTTIAFDNGLSLNPASYSELITFTSAYDGNGPWHLKVERDGEHMNIDVLPEYDETEDRYLIGIGFSDVAIDYVKVNIFNCWKYGFEYSVFIVRLTWSSFLSLFKGHNLNNLSGPVGIYNTVSEAVSYGWEYYIQLIAMISINVGVVNALPLPIFDGGRVLLLIIEAIIRKPLSEKAQNIIMSLSAALLLLLFVYITYNDISKLIGG
ncbi:MAG: site-2 protease family protein [Erysipelotrichaceae bacterium]|nr:site-2 protease family protein [Erysipelotrichaceae bacterium]